MKKYESIVLLSGGQDSATCLSLACRESHSVLAIAFDYGQRHRVELEKANALACLAGVPLVVVDAGFIASLSPNALVDTDIPVTTSLNELPSTFVPGRNLFFLSIAAVYARQHGVRTLYIGVCQTDFSGYPDCRDEFIKSAQKTINLAMDMALQIKAPLMFLTKSETIGLMNELGTLSWYKETHTCYHGKVPACGICPSCKLRLKGFHDIGMEDLISYESGTEGRT